MTPDEARVLSIVRNGGVPSVADTVSTIISLAELDAYRKGLSMRGALSPEAIALIRDRQDYLKARGLK
jgi:hypothetical protein